MYDILFKNISIIDGTGAPAYTGDVAVQDGKIRLKPNGDAKEVVDGTGLTLCPGFVDVHSHGDLILGTESGRVCKTTQGITTEFGGQCGETLFPISPLKERQDMVEELVAISVDKLPDISRFTTLEDHLKWAERQNLSCNFTLLTGHANLRIAAMGFDDRKPTAEEMDHMKAMLREAMEHGSKGLSSGLIYSPSCYADEDELVELCKVVAEYNGFYATHMRNEAADVVESVKESIRVAERAGCRLDISHHKICGKDNWGKSAETLKLVHEARERGVDVTLDVYPYTASMTTVNVCLPAHFFSNGPKKMQQLLRDPAVRKELLAEMETMDGRWRHCGGASGILIAKAPATPAACGKTIQAYADEIGKDSTEVFFDLITDNGHAVSGIFFSMCEEDLQRIVLDENAVIGTDGVVPNLINATHPRGMASFPKAIRYFVREKGLLTLEEMIRKMTSLPCQRFGIPNKGVIAEGYDADLLLIKADEITDRATYTNGLALSDGIERVLVNGITVYKDKQMTGISAGKFIPHRAN